MAIDNIVAVLLQPVFGNWSDRTKSRFGRRMPFIFSGTVISAVLFVFFPFARHIWGLVGIIFAFDLAMALYRSASVAIVADYTIDKFRAKASGLQQFISNFGGVIELRSTQFCITSHNTYPTTSVTAEYWIYLSFFTHDNFLTCNDSYYKRNTYWNWDFWFI